MLITGITPNYDPGEKRNQRASNWLSMDDPSFPQETTFVTQNAIRRRRSLLLATGPSLLCLFLMAPARLPLLIDVFRVARIRAELPRAIDRWESRGLSGYQVKVKGFVSQACIIDGELTIRDGHLVQIG